MSTLTMQERQLPVIEQSISLKDSSNHIPLVHVLTSRIDNDHRQVCSMKISFVHIELFDLFRKMFHLISRR